MFLGALFNGLGVQKTPGLLRLWSVTVIINIDVRYFYVVGVQVLPDGDGITPCLSTHIDTVEPADFHPFATVC